MKAGPRINTCHRDTSTGINSTPIRLTLSDDLYNFSYILANVGAAEVDDGVPSWGSMEAHKSGLLVVTWAVRSERTDGGWPCLKGVPTAGHWHRHSLLTAGRSFIPQ